MPRGYWSLWTAALAFFFAFYALLTLVPARLAALGYGGGRAAFIIGAFGVAAFVVRPFAGALADAWGHNRVVAAGAAALALGSAGMVLSDNAVVLFGTRLLQAGGYAAFTTAATARLAALLPVGQRARPMAFFGTAINAAMAVAPAAAAWGLSHLGLGVAFGLCAALGLIASTPGLKAQAPRTAANPGGWRQVFAVPPPLRRPQLLALCFGMGFGAFLLFLPFRAAEQGIAVGPFYTLYGVCILVGRLALGGLLEKIPPRTALASGFVLLAAGSVFFSSAAAIPGFILGTLCLATAGAVLHPMLLALHADRSQQQALGRGSAVFYLGFDAGISLGGWLPAPLVEAWGFQAAYLPAGAAALSGLVLALRLAPHPEDRHDPAG